MCPRFGNAVSSDGGLFNTLPDESDTIIARRQLPHLIKIAATV